MAANVLAMTERLREIDAEQAKLIEKNSDVIEISMGGWMNRRNEARYQRHCVRMDALNAEWLELTRQINSAGIAAEDVNAAAS